MHVCHLGAEGWARVEGTGEILTKSGIGESNIAEKEKGSERKLNMKTLSLIRPIKVR